MRILNSILIAFTLLIGLASFQPTMADPLELTAKKLDDRVQVFVGDTLFTEYRYRAEQKYPYFYPVNGPKSGKSVTTESSQPYPHHHSLFFGCDRVNGGNYWQDVNDRGQIVVEEIEIIKSKGETVEIQNTNLWKRPGAESPFRDVRKIVISAPSESIRIIDFEIECTALMDVTIQRTNHSLFSARMVAELSVKQGGTLINAHGDKGEEATLGKKAPWCDYFGTRDGITEGLAIFDHPQNQWYPSRWFTRDYGFFSPTEMNWLEEGSIEIAEGEKPFLEYRVIVHEGSAQDAKIGELFQQWIDN